MKIKKFVGRSFQEAFEQMKQELGPDAIILHSKKVKSSGGLDFLSGKPMYEITAGIDTPAAATETAATFRGLAEEVTTPRARTNGQRAFRPARGYSRTETAEQPSRPVTPNTPPPENVVKAWELERQKMLNQLTQLTEIKDEITDIKKVVNQVADFLKYSRMPALPEPFKILLKQLVDNDVHEDLAKAIVQTVYSHTNASDYKKADVIRRNLLNLIQRMIKIGRPLEQVSRVPYVVALVGPTGVGKTTTIAKIAANLKLFYNRKVALVSADTYRIAAIEQLQTFANIANIPMSVAYSPQEIREAVLKFREKDIILIDTVGRSQKHDQHLRELNKFVDAANPDEVHLVLSLTSSLRTMLDVVKRFQLLRPNRLIFSKLDEASQTGNIINVLYKHPLPVSYLTTGQTVPNDIVTADKGLLANLILKGEFAA